MKDRPNFIIIMTDQQRADICRREGFPLDTTPYLDQLARQAIWFNRAYTTMPCLPASPRQYVDRALSVGDAGADQSQWRRRHL